MKKLDVNLSDVQGVYNGAEAKLWELVMGEQIHVGGYAESMVLAQKAGVKEGDKVLDICCCLGAGLRFLVKNFNVKGYGIDAAQTMYEKAIKRAQEEGVGDSIEFTLGSALELPYPDNTFNVVWGEDAWCYTTCKDTLIKEAARVLKPGGTLAFSDWVEGSVPFTDKEAERVCKSGLGMTFPYLETVKGYEGLIAKHGLTLKSSEDLNDHFAEMIDFYLKMLSNQLLYDALKIVDDNMEFFQSKGAEIQFWSELAHAKKFSRGRWIAQK